MKKVLFTIFVLLSGINVFPQTTAKPTGDKPFDLIEYGVRIEPDKRLIVMMAALQFAGVHNSLGVKGTEFSNRVNSDLVGADENLRQRMTLFFNNYRVRRENEAATAKLPKPTQDELIAPFVSLAYSLTPEMLEPARTLDLPPDLLEVLDFAPMIKTFYRQTGFETRLPEYVKLYQAEADRMRPSVVSMVSILLSYLNIQPITVAPERVKIEVPDPNNPKKRISKYKIIEHERRFFIVPDLLAPVGTVNFRNIGNDYYVIVPPNTNFRTSESRRAFLQYVIDPLIAKNAKEISPFHDGIKSLLDDRRKSNEYISSDIYLATMRSLVAAIDSKQFESLRIQTATALARQKIDKAKTDADKLIISAQLAKDKQDFADESTLELSQAYERGAVLSFYFADQLKGVENSGFNLDGSLLNMINSIDSLKETDRLAQNAAASKRGSIARDERRKKQLELQQQRAKNVERSQGLKTKLAEIDPFIKNKEFGEADTRLRKLLDEYPGDSTIYYTLGRVASLSAASSESGGAGVFDEGLRDKRLTDAQLFFINAINSSDEETDTALIQLSYFALGRIFEFYEQNDKALQCYQNAVAIGQVSGGVYADSLAAVSRLTVPAAKP